ncbi:hypothetical protein B0H14DRAFT_2977229 [Mycena olivaceomarginata]|nr:hypothetical protein B0H14DRAFT_2977229 [Mycena olivaceomarginata]
MWFPPAFACLGIVLWILRATDAPLLMAFPVGYNVARLHLNMRRPPASVVSYGLRSERRICGILVAAPRPRPPSSGSWRGLREPYAPLFHCRALRALPPAAHILGWAPTRFPLPSRLLFAAAPIFRNRSPPRVLRGTWRILRHIPMWS